MKLFLLLYFALWGQQSLFDDGDTAAPTKELAAPITLELDKAMSAPLFVDPLEVIGLLTVGDYIATGVPVDFEGVHFIITCAHVIKGIKPQDEIRFTSNKLKDVKCLIAAVDLKHDLCVLLAESNDLGVEVSDEPVKVGDKLYTVGGNGKLGGDAKIIRSEHTVKVSDAIDKGTYYTDGWGVPGRSGSATFNEQGKLVGIFCGLTPKEKYLVQTRTTKLIPLFDLKQYKVTFYSGATCTFCKQQHAITDNVNDRRIIADWTQEPCPDWIIKRLPRGYQLPVAVWSLGKNKYSWPLKSGVNTIQTLVDMCEKSGAVSLEYVKVSEAMGAEAPVGTINVGDYVDQLFGWYNTYLPNNTVAKMDWTRSGDQSFNVLGGKKEALTLERLLGKTGSFKFVLIYPESMSDSEKLQIRELEFFYNVNGDDINFTIEEFTVHGIVKQINNQLVLKSSTEQPKGFIGFMTLYTIVSTARTIWIILHPVADICLGGSLQLSTYLDQQSQQIVIDFQAPPTVKILSLMTFNLAIKQVVISHMKIVTKFTGTMFAKQYTFNIRKN